MSQQNHIINRQVIEVHLPNSANVQKVQQLLSKVYNEQLLPVINTLLEKHFGTYSEVHHQISRLTIDLGELEFKDFTKRFSEEFDHLLTEIVKEHRSPDAVEAVEEEILVPKKGALEVVSHYLATGRLPWWCGHQSKLYVLEELEKLIEKPMQTSFKALLSELRLNPAHLSRFVNTFSVDQMLRSIDLVSGIAATTIHAFVTELERLIRKYKAQQTKKITRLQVLKTLIRTMLDQLPTDLYPGEPFSRLKGHYRILVLQELGVSIPTTTADQQNAKVVRSQTTSTNQKHAEISAIRTTTGGQSNPAITTTRSLVKKYRAIHRQNAIWQQFFQDLSKVLVHPSIQTVPDHLLEELERLLIDLQRTTQDTLLERDLSLTADRDSVNYQNQLESISKSILSPLAVHLHLMDKALQQARNSSTPSVIERLQSPFDDTDFITVSNAGLVILWPFLPKFFENLGLMTNKEFTEEEAKYKAVCALQYLCNNDQSELFEGTLSLPKILCEIALEDPIAIIELTEADIEVARGLLTSVIARGPSWKNLSLQGFMNSYLCRQGSLKIRDDHWLLQVPKETFDITLEKLPWGFGTVKLPWMNKIIQVEWI